MYTEVLKCFLIESILFKTRSLIEENLKINYLGQGLSIVHINYTLCLYPDLNHIVPMIESEKN